MKRIDEIDVAVIDGIRWRLKNDVRFRDNGIITFKVFAGFVTDFASSRVGRVNLLSYRATYSGAALLHDWLYFTGMVSRETADHVFLELLKSENVGYFMRMKAYLGVRLFGWIAWKEHRRKRHVRNNQS